MLPDRSAVRYGFGLAGEVLVARFLGLGVDDGFVQRPRIDRDELHILPVNRHRFLQNFLMLLEALLLILLG